MLPVLKSNKAKLLARSILLQLTTSDGAAFALDVSIWLHHDAVHIMLIFYYPTVSLFFL